MQDLLHHIAENVRTGANLQIRMKQEHVRHHDAMKLLAQDLGLACGTVASVSTWLLQ